MIELTIVHGLRQRRTVDEKLGVGQRLGRVAIIDALEADHHHIVGRPDGGDLEQPPVLRIKRSVVAERHRIAGERLDAKLALDAVRGADHGHLDGVFWLGHGGWRSLLHRLLTSIGQH